MKIQFNSPPYFFNFRTHCCLSCVSLILILIYNQDVFSADITLAWDANSEQDIIGYKLYYGTSSREIQDYPSMEEVGNQTTYTILGLTEGETYYFAVTAYSTYGESDFSEEISYAVPNEPVDSDGDGILDNADNCPNDPENDVDEDSICGEIDNCPEDYNPTQTDCDKDGTGDACDEDTVDFDGDGIDDGEGEGHGCDNCPEYYNPDQKDIDGDGVGNACDNCRRH